MTDRGFGKWNAHECVYSPGEGRKEMLQTFDSAIVGDDDGTRIPHGISGGPHRATVAVHYRNCDEKNVEDRQFGRHLAKITA